MATENRFILALLLMSIWQAAAPYINRAAVPPPPAPTAATNAATAAPAATMVTCTTTPCYVLLPPQNGSPDSPFHDIETVLLKGLLVLLLGLTGLAFALDKLHFVLEKAISLVGLWKRLVHAWKESPQPTMQPNPSMMGSAANADGHSPPAASNGGQPIVPTNPATNGASA